MRLILDQGLPRACARLLRDRGLAVTHAAEEGLSSATDAQILEFAREHQAVVVTLDADFHAALALSGASEPSVVRIRLEGLASIQLAALIATLVERFDGELEAGALVTVRGKSIGLRRLPLVR